MPVGVVDTFETIKIDHHYGKAILVGPGFCLPYLIFQQIRKGPPVAQSRQNVCASEIFQFAL